MVSRGNATVVASNALERSDSTLGSAMPPTGTGDAQTSPPLTVEGIPEGTRFFFVCNIPAKLRSRDLRAHFSDLVEKEAFAIFHYRHRTEVAEDGAEATHCCPVGVRAQDAAALLACNGQQWTDSKETTLSARVQIRPVVLQDDGATVAVLPPADDAPKAGLGSQRYLSKREQKALAAAATGPKAQPQTVPLSVFAAMAEFRPPKAMPQGNVGTPLRVFRELLAQCALPPSVIRKLGLVFVRDQRGLAYGEVPFVYTGPVADYNSDDSAEEWDRYEALHDDVDKQERNKEELFEQEVEVTWDKGSSGLVWHTDAAFWDDRAEEEPDVDDWDLDPRVHYRHNRSWLDHHARQRADMFARDRETARHPANDVAPFETHTRGVGSKILLRHGWVPGQGVGANSQGRPAPLVADGQMSRDKRGLGSHGLGVEEQAVYRTKYYEPAAQPETQHESGDAVHKRPAPDVVEAQSLGEMLPPARKPKLLTNDEADTAAAQTAQGSRSTSVVVRRRAPGAKEVETAHGSAAAETADGVTPLDRTPRNFVKYREVRFARGGVQGAPVLIGAAGTDGRTVLPSATEDVSGPRAERELDPNTRYVAPYFTSQTLQTMREPPPRPT